jgi:hypothetical protein
LNELRVTGLSDIAQREQPFQGVIGCGDEAVQAAGGLVLRFHVDAG